MIVINVVKIKGLVVVIVFEMTGLMVVVNVVKITGLIFVVNMVKMTGFLVVDNVKGCGKYSKNCEFCCCDQCSQNDGFNGKGNGVRIMVLVVVVYVVEMTRVVCV